MNEVFWARELAWLVEPTPRDAAAGVEVRNEKEWLVACGCASLSALEDVAGADETSGRSCASKASFCATSACRLDCNFSVSCTFLRKRVIESGVGALLSAAGV